MIRSRTTSGAASLLAHRLLFVFCYAPPTVLPFLLGSAGAEYGLGFWDKWRLMLQVFRNGRNPLSASTFLEQLTMVNAILSFPRGVEGAVAEFGCFNGMSSASLSLACSVTQRRLIIFDSFAGLPEAFDDVEISDLGAVAFSKGQFEGRLADVQANIRLSGEISVCEFVKGFYDVTLNQRPDAERYCLIFEDADLPSSVRSVLEHSWPRLQHGSPFFCHEARLLAISKMFFDDVLWNDLHGTGAPGLIGAGKGLTLSEMGSNLGYVRKTA